MSATRTRRRPLISRQGKHRLCRAARRDPSRSRMPKENRQIAIAGRMLPSGMGRMRMIDRMRQSRPDQVLGRRIDQKRRAVVCSMRSPPRQPRRDAADNRGEVGARHRPVGDDLRQPGRLAEHQLRRQEYERRPCEVPRFRAASGRCWEARRSGSAPRRLDRPWPGRCRRRRRDRGFHHRRSLVRISESRPPCLLRTSDLSDRSPHALRSMDCHAISPPAHSLEYCLLHGHKAQTMTDV